MSWRFELQYLEWPLEGGKKWLCHHIVTTVTKPCDTSMEVTEPLNVWLVEVGSMGSERRGYQQSTAMVDREREGRKERERDADKENV